MFAIAALLITTTFTQEEIVPVLWLDVQGNILIDGDAVEPQINPGVAKQKTPIGIAFNFSGEKSGILFGDKSSLKLTGNITVSAWLFPKSYAPNGAQSEVLFRGDDRAGYDPYFLALTKDGDIQFVIEDDKNEAEMVKTDIPLNQWTHITASLNAATGEMAMWENGVKVSTNSTTKRPIYDLIPKYVPGVGIGNVQNDKGPHNQPFNGLIADLRLYSKVLTPSEVGYQRKRVTASSGVQPK